MKATKKISFLIPKGENANAERKEVFDFMTKLIYEKKNPQYTEGTAYFNVTYEEEVEV